MILWSSDGEGHLAEAELDNFISVNPVVNVDETQKLITMLESKVREWVSNAMEHSKKEGKPFHESNSPQSGTNAESGDVSDGSSVKRERLESSDPLFEKNWKPSSKHRRHNPPKGYSEAAQSSSPKKEPKKKKKKISSQRKRKKPAKSEEEVPGGSSGTRLQNPPQQPFNFPSGAPPLQLAQNGVPSIVLPQLPLMPQGVPGNFGTPGATNVFNYNLYVFPNPGEKPPQVKEISRKKN